MAEAERWAASFSYGVPRVARLPGNVGYLELHGFLPPELASDAYESAMYLLAGSNSLIIDLRANGGGGSRRRRSVDESLLPVR